MFAKADPWVLDEPSRTKSLESWNLPDGPIAWEDRDSVFQELSCYPDLKLTEEELNGLLTDRVIASCKSYLTRSPASKYHIVAKLCLSSKNLNDIGVIEHHRFLQYIDLARNNIKDLSPLSMLPYLMYLDVSHNLLEKVLHFKAPWNLTFVNYSYNEVWQIDDLSDFWSLSYLDLSHNRISKIQGLRALRYLRHLNLSYNKIAKFENLNYLKITDLNLEHNIISSFETGDNVGLKTMADLCSLCLNNNLISSLEFLKGVYHVRKLELQGNRIINLLELRHMKSLRKLRLLDLSGNPVCGYIAYRNLLLNILPELKFLDLTEVNITEKVGIRLDMTYGLQIEAAKDSARMILLDQLNDAALDFDVLPVDQSSYPLVILVGPCATGKKFLISKLGEKYANKIIIGKLHTTREVMEEEKLVLINIKREEFYEKAKKGQFYCVMENLGHLFGFSKETLGSAVKSNKLCLTCMNLKGALTINSYGIKPYLILAMLSSKEEHKKRLEQIYGPIITMLGAAYVSKRKLAATHASNVRRVREILSDIIQSVIYLVEKQPQFCLCQNFNAGSTSLVISLKKPGFGKCGNRLLELLFTGKSEKDSQTVFSGNQNWITDIEVNNSSMFSREELISKFERIATCCPSTCGLQQLYKETAELKKEIRGDQSASSFQSKDFDEVVQDEESKTCSTSYSAAALQPIVIKSRSLDDEACFQGEDDVFVDWPSPFVNWDEVNVDPVCVEEAAEKLCKNLIQSMLTTRSVYENIHQNNPGLFSRVVLTDNIDEAMANLYEFLKKVWQTVPIKNSFSYLKGNPAYMEHISNQLKNLKKIIQEEGTSKPENSFFRFPHNLVGCPRSQTLGRQTSGKIKCTGTTSSRPRFEEIRKKNAEKRVGPGWKAEAEHFFL